MIKSRWRARLAGVAEPTGRGAILVPVKLLDDPGRYADLSIPASRMEALIRQLQVALRRERTLQQWAKGEGFEVDKEQLEHVEPLEESDVAH